jgi:hypothetical protein
MLNKLKILRDKKLNLNLATLDFRGLESRTKKNHSNIVSLRDRDILLMGADQVSEYQDAKHIPNPTSIPKKPIVEVERMKTEVMQVDGVNLGGVSRLSADDHAIYKHLMKQASAVQSHKTKVTKVIRSRTH